MWPPNNKILSDAALLSVYRDCLSVLQKGQVYSMGEGKRTPDDIDCIRDAVRFLEGEVMTITIPGQPQSKDRPRAKMIKKNGQYAPIWYSTKKNREYEARVKSCAAEAGFKDCDDPLEVVIDLFFKRPKSLHRKTDPDGHIWHTRKPDIDNVVKALLDGLFRSDAKVCSLVARKFYTAKGGHPRAIVTVSKVFE